MITWLFTQVWLWSLAAFALGALITWLLFVRPLRRRLAEFTAPCPEDEYAYDQAGGYEGYEADEQTAGDTPFDLLRWTPQRREQPDEPEAGDWRRAAQAWVTPEQAKPACNDSDSEWFREWDKRVNAVGVHRDAAAVQPRVPSAAEESAGNARPPGRPAEWVTPGGTAKPPAAGKRAGAKPRGVGEPAGTAKPESAGGAATPQASAESVGTARKPAKTPLSAESAAATRKPASPQASAEPDTVVESVVEPQVVGESAETVRTPAVTPAKEQPAEPATVWPDAEPETTESSARSPAEVVAAIAAEAAAGTPAKRAESSEPGNAERGADDATASRLSGQLRSLFEPVEPRRGGASGTPYVPPVGADATQVIPKVGDGGAAEPPPLPRRTPGAGPRPGRAGGSGPMIKGHSASRQYHSPESPAYGKIVADVWFRTPADAEIAGFEPWNGHRAT
ncbi:sunset domain-containing protein [Saccharopolyspora hattusasensis]|uniref:sunset domain-containing protein n=1 Tax=Saccharopolyspora hattusasensis TaxID=1128679 RepID=UPI003D95499B